ncbi:MAG: TIGR00300 family protein [Deltaproteobacteria bacterium]|nr:TIGR00300 family protein [Deltaproteobacteria bacterium]MCZ6562144.1 TIGR00300 family protein [Deltaproteobacteria bacterium]MCZ6621290.1 TIGR00300 family protein [Deltaproteobacteria bacterium]
MASSIVELSGHIIDSLILPKVLDLIVNLGGDFEILQVQVGHRRTDRSYAQILIETKSSDVLDQILARVREHGALSLDEGEGSVRLESAPQDGVFPEGFYATTNLATLIRLEEKWLEVQLPEMDCGIRVDVSRKRAESVPLHKVKKGDLTVVGHRGVKVLPVERQVPHEVFEFMSSSVSTERPKGLLIREIAESMKKVRRDGGKILVVAGPGLIHTGASQHLVEMIERGYVQVLFGGNGLAVHDIETALYGTSLGVYLDKKLRATEGHEHHLWAINKIRRAGGIKQAVEQGLLTRGVFYTCVKNGIDFLLAGSIRDDGPLPDVITDVLKAQDLMREKVRTVSFVLMMATTLHAIATGNLLPASVKSVIVDINPSVVTKLADRGTFQAMGLVTDVEPFLRELCRHLA